MTSIQRLIKLIADAIAIGLVVAIIGGAATAVLTITGVTSIKNEIHEFKESEDFTLFTFDENASTLSLDLMTASLTVETGDELSVYCSDDVKVRIKRGILKIEDTIKSLPNIASNHHIRVTIPKDYTFDKVTISSGAGSIHIKTLTCNTFDYDSGVGKTQIDYIKVKTSADIDGGVGETTVTKGNINNLDYSVGVGKSDITAKITGISSIEAGIGEVSVNLLGGKNIYTLKTETGIGAIKVDGQPFGDDQVSGNGKNVINVEGGIGTVRISFV